MAQTIVRVRTVQDACVAVGWTGPRRLTIDRPEQAGGMGLGFSGDSQFDSTYRSRCGDPQFTEVRDASQTHQRSSYRGANVRLDTASNDAQKERKHEGASLDRSSENQSGHHV